MNATSRTFEGLLDRYFTQLLVDSPAFATLTAGLPSGEGKLGSLSLSYHQRRARSRQTALRSLETVSPRELSAEQQLDRLALRNHLLKESEDYDRARYSLEPSAPEHVLNLLLHELMRADDSPAQAARNSRSLLAQTPDFLDEASAAVRKPESVWLNVMKQTVAGGAVLLDGVAAFLQTANAPGSGDGQSSKHKDTLLIASAKKALRRYQERAISRPLAPRASFAVGASVLQRRVRDELGLDYTLGQIEALALGEVNRVNALLTKAAGRFGRRQSPEKLLHTWRSQWRPSKPLLELYRAETNRVADAFRAACAVSFPKGDELQVKPVPEFLRTLIPTAAYLQPGAFQKRQRGVFWVNDLSLTKTSESDKLAEQQQHFGLSLTCAHEAYPGHHLQFVTANRHPRKWRRLFAHAVFYEGWTLWCEQMMVDLKIDRSPALQIQQLHDALWRCHRILVDLRLQTGRYSYEQAVRHLQQYVGFTQARAQADVNWYTAQPAVPMSYWLGRLENARLHQRLILGRGWSLQKFNDWLLSFGTLPQSWLEKYGLD